MTTASGAIACIITFAVSAGAVMLSNPLSGGADHDPQNPDDFLMDADSESNYSTDPDFDPENPDDPQEEEVLFKNRDENGFVYARCRTRTDRRLGEHVETEQAFYQDRVIEGVNGGIHMEDDERSIWGVKLDENGHRVYRIEWKWLPGEGHKLIDVPEKELRGYGAILEEYWHDPRVQRHLRSNGIEPPSSNQEYPKPKHINEFKLRGVAPLPGLEFDTNLQRKFWYLPDTVRKRAIQEEEKLESERNDKTKLAVDSEVTMPSEAELNEGAEKWYEPDHYTIWQNEQSKHLRRKEAMDAVKQDADASSDEDEDEVDRDIAGEGENPTVLDKKLAALDREFIENDGRTVEEALRDQEPFKLIPQTQAKHVQADPGLEDGTEEDEGSDGDDRATGDRRREKVVEDSDEDGQSDEQSWLSDGDDDVSAHTDSGSDVDYGETLKRLQRHKEYDDQDDEDFYQAFEHERLVRPTSAVEKAEEKAAQKGYRDPYHIPQKLFNDV